MTTEKPGQQNEQQKTALGAKAARTLTTTSKSKPQMQGISSRWLMKMLPWEQTVGGVFRLNRRLTFGVGDGRVSFRQTGARVDVIPEELRELPLLRGFEDVELLTELAARFIQQDFDPGALIVEAGKPAEHVVLLAHGRAEKLGQGKYGKLTVLDVMADGAYFGDAGLVAKQDTWAYSVKATTRCTVLLLEQSVFEALVAKSDTLAAHVERYKATLQKPQTGDGEASVEVSSGHVGEQVLPSTFVDYAESPREFHLSVAQTVLRVHSRVADLYNVPMNQTEQQLRLTIEALRERQEYELVNNPDFGLLHNTPFSQRIYSRSGAPTPDDMDELLGLVWKKPGLFLAHPKAIAAFGRECNRRGVYPDTVDVAGHKVPGWRGIPIFPCNKLPVSPYRTSSIMLMRLGKESQGVIGLHQTGLPDEVQPGLNVRFMGIDEKAIISYLVSTYYSAAVLVPDAIAVLEDVELGNYAD